METIPGPAFFHYDEIDWVDERKEGKAPLELIEEGERRGARRKRFATGQGGFHMTHNVMPAGYTVPGHSHPHDELIVVIEGGCTLLDGGPTLQAKDAVVLAGDYEYGFTCGPEGMTFLTIRGADSGTSVR